jgi:hypothetical protein
MTNSRKKKFSGANRRRWPRLNPSALPSLKSVAFNQGSEVQVIDISRGGMLLETEVRLRPQMRILLKVATSEGVFKIGGHVVRSSITSLQGAPRYQSAIAFENPFHQLADNALADQMQEPPREPPVESAAPATHDKTSGQKLSQTTPNIDNGAAILTVVACDERSVSLLERFRQNDW